MNALYRVACSRPSFSWAPLWLRPRTTGTRSWGWATARSSSIQPISPRVTNNPQIGPASSETIRDSDLGFTGALGVQFNRNWRAELNFIQLGKFSYKYTYGANTQRTSTEVSGWGVSLLPTIPLTRNFSLFGRLGVLAAQTRLTLRNPALPSITPGAPTFDGSIQAVQVNTTTFLSGFGAQYFFNRDFRRPRRVSESRCPWHQLVWHLAPGAPTPNSCPATRFSRSSSIPRLRPRIRRRSPTAPSPSTTRRPGS